MAEVGVIWADDADLVAIYNYVESRRPDIATNPLIQPMIIDFEKWYQGLSWFDVHVMINDTIAEAKRRRDLLNVALGDTLDPTIVPADRINVEPGSSGTLAGSKPPWIPNWVKYAAAGVAGLTLILSGVSYSAVKAYKP